MQPHEILGARPGADGGELTDAFRRYALRHHPDRGGNPAVFQGGVEAYRQVLGARRPTRPDRPHRAEVVFYRRSRPGIPSLLRLAGRRLTASLLRL